MTADAFTRPPTPSVRVAPARVAPALAAPVRVAPVRLASVPVARGVGESRRIRPDHTDRPDGPDHTDRPDPQARSRTV